MSLASMGPQLYRCGNGASNGATLASRPSFNGAATLSLRKYPERQYGRYQFLTLQWGRNFIVAEMLEPFCLLLLLPYSFNGAATLSLRKWQNADRNLCHADGFNGAATLSLRKYTCPMSTSTQSSSFNGAATLSLRKYANLDQSTSAYVLLQWGRNFIVAEISPH